MGRLFWKFFFSFWLSVILTGLGVGGAVWLADQSWHDSGAQNDTQPRFIPPESEALLKVAAELIKVGDFNALRLLLARFDEHSLLTVYVIDSKDQDLLGRQIAASDILRARTHAKEANTSETTTVKVGDSGDSYLVFIKHDRIYDKIGLFEASLPADLRRSGSPNSRSFPAGEFLSPPPHVFGASPFRRPPSPIAVLIVLGLISSLLASLLLARHFAKPIWQLRTALLSVADGNLDTRIAPVMKTRHDEMAELGIYFDSMTQKISGLLESQKQLLHDVSHELRSPLARIQAAIGLAQQQPDKIANTLPRIERELRRINDLVEELLLIARLESDVGRSSSFSRIHLDSIIDEVATNARFETENKNIIISAIGQCNMVIHGDTELLHRALDNIVRNAMKYANHMVSIRVTRILENKNNMVVIFVEDDGAGIVEQNLGNIFQPFFRSPQHIKDKGTGLGLTIAQRAVRLHGGYILARNRPEGGLCVEVRLPAL